VPDANGDGTQSARQSVRRSMRPKRLCALMAVAIVGASCAGPARQPAPESPEASASTSAPGSVRNGELALAGPHFTAWLVAPDGSGLHPVALPDTTATITPWAYSPDGTHIAYTGYERGDAGDYAIYVSDADGSDVTDLTSRYLDPVENNQGLPVWSPDGTQIAFDNDSNDPSMQGTYLMNADGYTSTSSPWWRSRKRSFPTSVCHATTGKGSKRLPDSGTDSRISVHSSPEGIRRSTGSAAIVPASTTTFTDTVMCVLLPGRGLPSPIEDPVRRSTRRRQTNDSRRDPWKAAPGVVGWR
jgi:WD40-like Beta Propeller Repeat